jgi:putative membrane-bound dehydrogenase-like protein
MRFSALVLLLVVPSVHAQRQFGFDNKKASGQPYLTPEETVKRMQVPDGFEVKLFAGEPQLVNPIAMTVDEKGRVWVVECFEYPKRAQKGKMPRDRIVILEDTDGDGACDKRTVFCEGKDFPVPFDMASGIEVGYGGVYVGAPPYLFHIENKNDKPGKFEILLKGFGSQDTHETLNTFQWGPDGWLYGLHGIYTQSEVIPYGNIKDKAEPERERGIKMNAAVWRFHPKSKKFEIFSEGTSNPWGMDWRNTDGQFILCCCVIPHLFHMVPGGIYKRQGGQGFNPYTYGEIKEICDHTFHKESGWAHAGLISLDTPLMPEKYRNSVIFGSIHGCSLKQNILKPNGSTYTASRGDDFLVSGDKNFRPINLRWGPNGEIYCIDWHDQNPCHQAAHDSWDYERGRVYRIQPKGLKTKKAEDLGRLSDDDLAKTIYDTSNPWRSRTSGRLLSERSPSKQKIEWKPGSLTMVNLRHVLAILTSQSLSPEQIDAVLREIEINRDTAVRAGLVRLLARLDKLDEKTHAATQDLIRKEKSPSVRREFASAAIRWESLNPPIFGISSILMGFQEDAQDPVIPQLLWLAIESEFRSRPPSKEELYLYLRETLDTFKPSSLADDYLVPRTIRRVMATGQPQVLEACLRFIVEAEDTRRQLRALEGLTAALQNRTVDAPPNWNQFRELLLKSENREIVALTNKLAINFRDADAINKSLAVAVEVAKSVQDRISAVRDLALATPQAAVKPLLVIATSDKSDELRVEALRALGSYSDPAIAKELLASYEKLPRNLKGEVINLLAARKDTAKALLDAVAAKKVERADLNDNTILRIQALKDKDLDAQVEKVWGRLRATPAELTAVLNLTRAELGTARASFERGKLAFDTHCAKCHKFEGRGFEVGPNIEGAARDIEYLLVNVLDPNRVIGAPYFIRTVTLLNGKNEIGILAAEDDQTLTLKTENGVLKVIPKKEIEESRIQEKSLMPEGFGSNIKMQEFRDLIRYTMANPFITEVAVEYPTMPNPNNFMTHTPIVGVDGRVPIDAGAERFIRIRAKVDSPAEMKTRLLVGVRNDVKLFINDDKYEAKGANAAAQPDQVGIDVRLKKGENRLLFEFKTKGGKDDSFYARFHDPDRKLVYPESKD